MTFFVSQLAIIASIAGLNLACGSKGDANVAPSTNAVAGSAAAIANDGCVYFATADTVILKTDMDDDAKSELSINLTYDRESALGLAQAWSNSALSQILRVNVNDVNLGRLIYTNSYPTNIYIYENGETYIRIHVDDVDGWFLNPSNNTIMADENKVIYPKTLSYTATGQGSFSSRYQSSAVGPIFENADIKVTTRFYRDCGQ